MEESIDRLTARLKATAGKSRRRRVALKQLQKALALEQAINRLRLDENKRLWERINEMSRQMKAAQPARATNDPYQRASWFRRLLG